MPEPACSSRRWMTPIEPARGPKERHTMSLFRLLPLLVVLNALLVTAFDSAADLSSPQGGSSSGEGAGPERATTEQQEKQEEHQRPTGIVIMAQGRSGSTMLGETFRQNKDILYWYEPCRSWGVGLFDSSSRYHREIHGEECAALVRRLTLCEFTLWDSARLGVDPKALDSGSPTLSPLRAAYDNPSADVLARAHEVVIDTCKRSRAVVVKTIRADAGIGGGDRNAGGVLVVHLVRDPRAVIHSQIKTFNVGHKYRRYFKGPPVLPPEGAGAGAAVAEDRSPGGPAGSTNATQQQEEGGYLPWGGEGRARALGHIICGVYRDQLDSSSELNSRYLRVRYEDIAAAADVTVKRVYDWAGLGAVPARVSLWINENTRLPDCDDHDSVAAANEHENDRAMTETATSHGGGGSGSGSGSGSNGARLRAAEEEVMAAIGRGGGAGAGSRRVLASDGGSGDGGGESGSGGDQGSGKGSGGHHEGEQRHVSCKEMMAKQVEWDRYGTRRHSAAMVGLWRTQMPAREATAVWEACASSGVLEEMGYAQ